MGPSVSSSNKEDTELPCAIFSMAWASMGAVATDRIFSHFLTISVASIESVTTRDFMFEDETLSTAAQVRCTRGSRRPRCLRGRECARNARSSVGETSPWPDSAIAASGEIRVSRV